MTKSSRVEDEQDRGMNTTKQAGATRTLKQAIAKESSRRNDVEQSPKGNIDKGDESPQGKGLGTAGDEEQNPQGKGLGTAGDEDHNKRSELSGATRTLKPEGKSWSERTAKPPGEREKLEQGEQ